MSDRIKAPWHLWLVGIVTLLFNAFGGFSYTMTRLGRLADLEMTPDQIAYFDSYPTWANTFWALGVWGAIACSLLILLRSRYAVTAIIIATIGLIGTSIFQHILTETPESLKSTPLVIAIWATTLLMLWYSYRQTAAGVLR